MTLTEWINFLSTHNITEETTPELYDAAISASHAAEYLAKIVLVLQEMGGDCSSDYDFYHEIMCRPIQAEDNLFLIEKLRDSNASFMHDYPLYLTVVRLSEEKSRLLSTMDLLHEYGLVLPTHADHYTQALYHPESKIKTILDLVKQFGALLFSDSWLYLLAIKRMDAIIRDPDIFTVLERRGINPTSNRKVIEAVLQARCSSAQIARNFDTLGAMGLKVHDYEELYLAASSPKVHSETITQAFEALSAIGANFISDPDHYKAAIEVSATGLFTTGFSALRQSGINFSANKKLYLTCLENLEKAALFEGGFSILIDEGISAASHPVLYDAMMRYAKNRTVASCFTVLKKAGATLPECESLYLAAIEYLTDSTALEQGFDTLRAFGYYLPTYAALYKKMISVSDHADKLYPVLLRLKEKGVDFSVIPEIVLTAMDLLPKMNAVLRIMTCFDKMNPNINGSDHPELYQIIMKYFSFSDDILIGWDLLENAGFGLEHKEMYLLLAEKMSRSNQLNAGLMTLIEQGSHASINKDLFIAVIEAAFLADYIKSDFITLNRLGLNPRDWDSVYIRVAKNSGTELSDLLQKMHRLNFNVSEHAELITTMVLDTRYSASLFALSWLESKGFDVKNHSVIYAIFFLNKPCLCNDPYLLKKVQDAVELFLQGKKALGAHEEGFKEQHAQIQGVIAAIVNKHNEITQGPLKKSAATKEFERVLKKIAHEGIDQLTMSYEATYGYVLTFHDEEIYLNELMMLVNFSHLELDREQDIVPLGRLIQQLIPNFNQHRMEDPHIVLNSLPLVAEHALSVYTTWYHYNINRIFRGLPQRENQELVWVAPADGRENLLANFLCGCLVNWAAAELPRALVDSPERRILRRVITSEMKRFQEEHGTGGLDAEKLLTRMKSEQKFYEHLLMLGVSKGTITEAERSKVAPLFEQLHLLFPKYDQVIRIEDIQGAELDGHTHVRKAREANPVHLPSVMSTSSGPKNSLAIFGADVTIFNPDAFAYTPIISKTEQELLSPVGETFFYTGNPQGFFARAVNSPDAVPTGGYWSALALIEANKNYLRHPYKDADKDTENQILVDGTVIERPNHGLAHEYRVMLYIDVVIDYYSLHAEDEEFRSFCQQMSFKEREWLRVAAAYSVTGRESEIGASDNLARYTMYREASCNHLSAFLKKHPPEFSDAAMAARISYLVRWMGNPAFEKGPDNPVDEKERQHRNFLNRILSTAHKLDLPRCYTPSEFEQSMELCRKLSKSGEQQQQDYIQMVRYAIGLLHAHGDAVQTDINASGELFMGTQHYCSPFGKVQNLKALHEVTRSVPRPKFDKIEMGQSTRSAPAA